MGYLWPIFEGFKMDFILYDDGAHAWAQVEKSLLADLNIASEISSYSYMHGGSAFLEEDCDLGVLIKALKSRGIDFEFIDKYDENSPIRTFDRYKAEPKTQSLFGLC